MKNLFYIVYGFCALIKWTFMIAISPIMFVATIAFSLLDSEGNYEKFVEHFWLHLEHGCPPIYWLLTIKQRRIEKFQKDVKSC